MRRQPVSWPGRSCRAIYAFLALLLVGGFSSASADVVRAQAPTARIRVACGPPPVGSEVPPFAIVGMADAVAPGKAFQSSDTPDIRTACQSILVLFGSPEIYRVESYANEARAFDVEGMGDSQANNVKVFSGLIKYTSKHQEADCVRDQNSLDCDSDTTVSGLVIAGVPVPPQTITQPKSISQDMIDVQLLGGACGPHTAGTFSGFVRFNEKVIDDDGNKIRMIPLFILGILRCEGRPAVTVQVEDGVEISKRAQDAFRNVSQTVVVK